MTEWILIPGTALRALLTAAIETVAALAAFGGCCGVPSPGAFAAAGGLFFLVALALNHGLLSRQSAAHADHARREERGEIGELAGGLAHEIRNPLNTIRFNLKMLEEDSCGGQSCGPQSRGTPADPASAAADERRAALESVRVEVGRLEKLLKSYLEFARPAAPGERREVRLDRLLEDLLSFVEEEFAAAGCALLPDFAAARGPVRTDPDALRRAVLNLLINAREAMAGSGAIRVRAAIGRGAAEIVVEDEGPGVAPEAFPHLFDPFFSTKAGGTGLGLAIARRVVEGLGGAIAVENVSSGARFTIRLPA